MSLSEIQLTIGNDVEITDRLHHMPCNISHDGQANVSAYFDTVTKEPTDKTKYHKNSFRGRPLLGAKTKLPDGYTGIIAKEKKKTASDKQARKLTAELAFKEYMYWNLDARPSANDAQLRCLDWVDLSSTLHEEINMEEEKKKEKSSGDAEIKSEEEEK